MKNTRKVKMKIKYRPKIHRKIIEDYVKYYSDKKVIKVEMPTTQELAGLLGVTNHILLKWTTLSYTVRFLLKKLQDLQEWYLMTHNTVNSIFLLKSLFGYKDNTSTDINVRAGSYDNTSLDNLIPAILEEVKRNRKVDEVEKKDDL